MVVDNIFMLSTYFKVTSVVFIKKYREIVFLIFTQLLLLILTSFIWLVESDRAAFSAFLGGLTALVPNLVFFLWMLLHKKRLTQFTFFIGEMLKVFLTVFLFIGFSKNIDLQWMPLLMSFILVIKTWWLFPLFLNKKKVVSV